MGLLAQASDKPANIGRERALGLACVVKRPSKTGMFLGFRFRSFLGGAGEPPFERFALPKQEEKHWNKQEPEGVDGAQGALIVVLVDAGEDGGNAWDKAIVVFSQRPVDQSSSSNDILARDKTPNARIRTHYSIIT